MTFSLRLMTAEEIAERYREMNEQKARFRKNDAHVFFIARTMAALQPFRGPPPTARELFERGYVLARLDEVKQEAIDEIVRSVGGS